MISNERRHYQNTLRTMVVGVLIIFFFVGIVIMYYNMVCKEKKDGIIKDGKIAARQSARQFDRYLSTNIDLINLTAYTLDGMLEEKKTDDEIQDYLVGQSVAIKSAVLENSTGLYGYINDRFFSGTYWTPPEGYDATIRPWYTKPMSNKGKLTILEPYVDVQSGNTMLALGKTLADGKSVLSVDVSLDQMQKLTEEAVIDNQMSMEMILTGQGVVVTHSDINEVGKDYSRESGTLGAEIVKLLSSGDDNFFEVEFEGQNYAVYDSPFQGDWHCISVHNATSVFDSLNTIFILTIIIVVIIVVTLGTILAVSSRRGVVAERAVASNEAKTSFLSNMSHEIRTPINAVLGMNEMILRECGDKDILSYSQNIKTAGQNLLGIVNDILDFSKIEAGKLSIIPENYDLFVMINDIENMIKQRAEKKDLTFGLELDQSIPRYLFGDMVRIEQVITNLLTNAVKYTEKGSVIFKLFYDKDETDPESIFLNVCVEDTGIGIKDEDMDKLFSEFERIEEKRNRNIEGAGLGMNITERLLDMMGSKLLVESVYGKGSKFSFSVKQKVTDSEPIGDFEALQKENKATHSEYRVRFTAPNARILVVDDNPMNLMVFTSLLKKTELIIDTAESGDEGVELSQEHVYDVIFLDHMMPKKDGIETLKEIRADEEGLNSSTPTVCLTANAISGAREEYLSVGFDDYMTKPIDPEKLEALIVKYLPKEMVKIRSLDEIAEENDEDLKGSVGDLSLLDEINGIDVSAGMKNCGTKDTYMLLLKAFCSSIVDKASQIEESVKKGDIKNFTIYIHALKSSARTIGALTLGEECQALEIAGKHGDKAYIEEHIDDVMTSCKDFRTLLLPLFEKEDKGNEKPEADAPLINSAFEKIRSAADEMDCDSLKEIIKVMDKYRIPSEYENLWKDLRTASDNYDYDAVIGLLDNR